MGVTCVARKSAVPETSFGDSAKEEAVYSEQQKLLDCFY